MPFSHLSQNRGRKRERKIYVSGRRRLGRLVLPVLLLQIFLFFFLLSLVRHQDVLHQPAPKERGLLRARPQLVLGEVQYAIPCPAKDGKPCRVDVYGYYVCLLDEKGPSREMESERACPEQMCRGPKWRGRGCVNDDRQYTRFIWSDTYPLLRET